MAFSGTGSWNTYIAGTMSHVCVCIYGLNAESQAIGEAVAGHQKIIMIWRFPKIVVPPNHPFHNGIFHYQPSSYWGTTLTMETSIELFPSGPLGAVAIRRKDWPEEMAKARSVFFCGEG